jgi:hypothetical protein
MFDGPQPGPDAADVATFGQHAYGKFMARRAAELGITLPKHDEQHLDSLGTDLYEGRGAFSNYYTALEDVLSQMDIPIVIGPVENMKLKAETPTNEELQTKQAKYQTLELAKMFNSTPVNLTKRLGITKVALTARSEGFGGMAMTHEGVLIVDITHSGEDRYGVAEHEYAHLTDGAECGADNINHDPAYASLNRHAQYADEWPLPKGFLITMPQPGEALDYRRLNELEAELKAAIKAKDVRSACTLQTTINMIERDVEMESDYSYSRVQEDKAELGKNLFNTSNYPDMLDTKSPVRRAKFLLLLARLYELAPEVVEYYSLEMTRPLRPTDWCVVPLGQTAK